MWLNIFIPENRQILRCRFLDALVLIRGILLYVTHTIFYWYLTTRASSIPLMWLRLQCLNIIICMNVCMYVCMYAIRDRQDPIKGSGWVLFPSTMAEQPIQQVCLFVCIMYVCMRFGTTKTQLRAASGYFSLPLWLNNQYSKWRLGICALRNVQNSDCYLIYYNLHGPTIKWASQHQVMQHKRS